MVRITLKPHWHSEVQSRAQQSLSQHHGPNQPYTGGGVCGAPATRAAVSSTWAGKGRVTSHLVHEAMEKTVCFFCMCCGSLENIKTEKTSRRGFPWSLSLSVQKAVWASNSPPSERRVVLSEVGAPGPSQSEPISQRRWRQDRKFSRGPGQISLGSKQAETRWMNWKKLGTTQQEKDGPWASISSGSIATTQSSTDGKT